MSNPKCQCAVCTKKFRPRNNIEAARAGLKRAKFACSPRCRKELRRLQQLRRRGAPRSRLIPQLRLPV